MKKTLVVADLHGQMRLLLNALEHSDFDESTDTLVVAGDTCDIGKQTMEIHEFLFDLGAVQLIGNHEIAHLCGMNIRPYDVSLDPGYVGFIGIGIDLGNFKMAHAVEGVLITHAGLSKRLAMIGLTEQGREDSNLSVHHHSGTLSAEVAANSFNERLKRRVLIEYMEHDDGVHPLLTVDPDVMWTDWFYPFWFRPYDYADVGPVERCGFYDRFQQVVGHTPVGSFNSKQQRLIAESGVHLIDAYNKKYFDLPGYCRYAIISDGAVTVHTNIEGI